MAIKDQQNAPWANHCMASSDFLFTQIYIMNIYIYSTARMGLTLVAGFSPKYSKSKFYGYPNPRYG